MKISELYQHYISGKTCIVTDHDEHYKIDSFNGGSNSEIVSVQVSNDAETLELESIENFQVIVIDENGIIQAD